MHSERFRITEENAVRINAAARIIAVGTTSTRVLESQGLPLTAREGATDIFIHPPYQPRAVDALLTNFHLPRSTLMALVGAFLGDDGIVRLKALYTEAIAQNYRFYTYGDAMLITNRT